MHRVPLGGNGFNAPQAAYIINNMSLTGDATGGTVQHRIRMDERFCSLIAFAAIAWDQATPAAATWNIQISGHTGSNLPIPPQLENRHIVEAAATVTATSIADIWQPVPFILPGAGGNGQLFSQVVNNDTDVVRVSLLVYLFNVRVREISPMGPLLWARGAT